MKKTRVKEGAGSRALRATSLGELEEATGGNWRYPSRADRYAMAQPHFQSVYAHFRSTRNGVSTRDFNCMGYKEYERRHMGGGNGVLRGGSATVVTPDDGYTMRSYR